VDRERRTIWIADVHRDNGKPFVVHADEKLMAFLELEAVIRTVSAFSANVTNIPLETSRHQEQRSRNQGNGQHCVGDPNSSKGIGEALRTDE
jgi:hypothetical protein